MPGEQVVEVGGDDLLERHEALAVGHDDEPGQHRRHLHPGEPPLAGHGVPERRRPGSGTGRDVRERVPGIDGERREHREDAAARTPRRGTRGRRRRARPSGRTRCRPRRAPAPPRLRKTLLEPDREPARPGRRSRRAARAGSRPSGEIRADAGGQLVHQAGHPHLEELVEVLAEDGAELRPLQQRQGSGRRPARARGR